MKIQITFRPETNTYEMPNGFQVSKELFDAVPFLEYETPEDKMFRIATTNHSLSV